MLRRSILVGFCCLSVILLGWPARASHTDHDEVIPASDPNTGAQGTFYLHLDDAGVLQYMNGYAETADWFGTVWWTPAGGFQFGDVVLKDPALNSLDGAGRASLLKRGAMAREIPFETDPGPNYPDPGPGPIVPGSIETCQECINRLRETCRLQGAAEASASWLGGAIWTYQCFPPAAAAAPLTSGGSFVGCVVVGVGIIGGGVLVAARHRRACNEQAPFTCQDWATGKPCIQLGYN